MLAQAQQIELGDIIQAIGVMNIVLGAVVFVVVCLVTPRSWRMPLLLLLAPLVLVTAMQPQLVYLAVASKVVGLIIFVLLPFAAWRDPGPKRALPWVTVFFPILALYGFLFVFTTTDSTLLCIIQAQLFFVAVSALLVCRTIVDQKSFYRVIDSLALGHGLVVAFYGSAVFLDPDAQTFNGLGRFQPWNANAVQTGGALIPAVFLGLLMYFNSSRAVKKVLYGTIASAAVGMIVLTASRSALIGCVFCTIPIFLGAFKNPLYVALLGVFSVLGIVLVSTFAADLSASRLSNLETGRVDVFMEYSKEIAQRPAVGLMGSEGELGEYSERIGTHSHNIYIDLLYKGGLAYFLPYLALFVLALVSAVFVLFKRKRFDLPPSVVSTVSIVVVFSFLYGWVNSSILYPTKLWSFLFIMLSSLLICWFYEFVSQSYASRDAAVRGMGQPA